MVHGHCHLSIYEVLLMPTLVLKWRLYASPFGEHNKIFFSSALIAGSSAWQYMTSLAVYEPFMRPEISLKVAHSPTSTL